jgi:hypothetical protein
MAVTATLKRAFLATDKRFAYFYNVTGTAEWRKLAGTECFANAMR